MQAIHCRPVLLLSCAKSHMLSASRRQPHLLHESAVDRRQIWSMDKSWRCVTLSGFLHSHIVGETPFLVARITVALACPKTIQQWPLTSVKSKLGSRIVGSTTKVELTTILTRWLTESLSRVWCSWQFLPVLFYVLFPFSALTLLIGRQEGHPAYNDLGDGLLVVSIWLELCTRLVAPVFTTTFIILSSNKIQSGKNSGTNLPRLSWKMAIKTVLCRHIIHC